MNFLRELFETLFPVTDRKVQPQDNNDQLAGELSGRSKKVEDAFLAKMDASVETLWPQIREQCREAADKGDRILRWYIPPRVPLKYVEEFAIAMCKKIRSKGLKATVDSTMVGTHVTSIIIAW